MADRATESVAEPVYRVHMDDANDDLSIDLKNLFSVVLHDPDRVHYIHYERGSVPAFQQQAYTRPKKG